MRAISRTCTRSSSTGSSSCCGTPHQWIEPYLPGDQDPDDLLLRMDLDASLEQFVARSQAARCPPANTRPTEWARTAEHEEYRTYSVFIMFRHLALHDFLHAYRIEELLLRPKWPADNSHIAREGADELRSPD